MGRLGAATLIGTRALSVEVQIWYKPSDKHIVMVIPGRKMVSFNRHHEMYALLAKVLKDESRWPVGALEPTFTVR